VSLFFCVGMFAAALTIFAPSQTSAADTIDWAPFNEAVLRVDGEPPKEWNLYRDTHARGYDTLLFQWDKRYLRIDTKTQAVHELDPSTIKQEKKGVISPSVDPHARPLRANTWITADVGPAYRVSFVLVDENHTVDMDIPWKQ
jgi:hypothetical protein